MNELYNTKMINLNSLTSGNTCSSWSWNQAPQKEEEAGKVGENFRQQDQHDKIPKISITVMLVQFRDKDKRMCNRTLTFLTTKNSPRNIFITFHRKKKFKSTLYLMPKARKECCHIVFYGRSHLLLPQQPYVLLTRGAKLYPLPLLHPMDNQEKTQDKWGSDTSCIEGPLAMTFKQASYFQSELDSLISQQGESD